MLDALFSNFCHQMPERSFALGPAVLPFCQRCTGVYLGALAAAIFFASHGRRQRAAAPPPILWLNVCFILAMGIFGFHLVETSAPLRYVTGALFGSAVVLLAWPLLLTRLIPQPLSSWNRADVIRYALVLAALLAGPFVLGRLPTSDPAASRLLASAIAIIGLLGLTLILTLPNALLALLIVPRLSTRVRRAVLAAVLLCLLSGEILVILRI